MSVSDVTPRVYGHVLSAHGIGLVDVKVNAHDPKNCAEVGRFLRLSILFHILSGIWYSICTTAPAYLKEWRINCVGVTTNAII